MLPEKLVSLAGEQKAWRHASFFTHVCSKLIWVKDPLKLANRGKYVEFDAESLVYFKINPISGPVRLLCFFQFYPKFDTTV